MADRTRAHSSVWKPWYGTMCSSWPLMWVRRVSVAASALRTGRASRRNGAFTARTCAAVTGELGGVPRNGWEGVERALYTVLQTPLPNSIWRSLESRQISRSSVK